MQAVRYAYSILSINLPTYIITKDCKIKPSTQLDERVASTTTLQERPSASVHVASDDSTHSLDQLEHTSLGDEQEGGGEDRLHELGLDTLVQAYGTDEKA